MALKLPVVLKPMTPNQEIIQDKEKLMIFSRHEYMRQCGVIDRLTECFDDCNEEFEVAFDNNLIIIKIDK